MLKINKEFFYLYFIWSNLNYCIEIYPPLILFITLINSIKAVLYIFVSQKTNKMLEESYISDKNISKSMTKLNHLSSEKKFRLKSLRLRTQEKLSIMESPAKKKLNLPLILKINSQIYDSPMKFIASMNEDSPNIIINNKIRIKSSLLQKDYEEQIQNQLNIPKDIIQQLFKLKLDQEQIKATQQKYFQFCKILFLRLIDKVEINIEGFNFHGKTLFKFLQFFLNWKQKNIIALDLSLCSQLARELKTKKQEEQQLIKMSSKINQTENTEEQPLWPAKSILTRLVLQDSRLIKLVLRNMHISPEQMVDLLTQCLKSQKIYSLDISNKGSQSINRIGTDYYYLEAFFAKNQCIGVIKMDNLNVTDQCIQRITAGISKNGLSNPLKILSLNGNLLTQKSLSSIYSIMIKAGLSELNLSNNPLGRNFFIEMKNLRNTTIKFLELSSTGMDSESLIHFLEQLNENKSLEQLRLDNNNFSHHWFNKMKDVFEAGLSLQCLSLASCSIKNFDQLFDGITYSKYLKRLNLNYNLVDIQNQNIQKIVNCLKQNKSLQEVKIRFCGYNQSILRQLIQSLKSNRVLQLFDISENHLSDNGGKAILRMLSENKSIKQIGIEKLQLTVKMSEQILKLLDYNRQTRQKSEKFSLIDENKIIKSKDILSWNQISKLQAEALKLQKQVAESKNKNQLIQLKIGKKKANFIEFRKHCKNQEKNVDKLIKNQQIQLNSHFQKILQQIEQITRKQNQSMETLQIESNLIKALENKIAKENEKIKKREHQLQEQLRDEKYMQKKKQKLLKQKQQLQDSTKLLYQKGLKSKNSSQMFDNTKSVISISKRKNSSTQKKG